MKNEEFLQLLSGIDEKLIENAGKDLENYHKAATSYNSRKKTWKRITAAACAAAAMVGAVFLVKNFGDIPTGESSGAVLRPSDSQAFSIDISDYSSISEPTSSEPEFSNEIMKRVMNEGYDFLLEIMDCEENKLYSQPIPKTDGEKEIAIAVHCSPESEGRRFTIVFYSYNDGTTDDDGITKDRIAKLDFTARSYIQFFSVPYNWNELEEGDECIMQLVPEDGDYTSRVVVKGKILP